MQDFARHRDKHDLETAEAYTTEWTPDLPSVILGILLGVFVAIIGFKVADYRATQTAAIEIPIVEQIEDTTLTLDFYDALKTYEVLPRTRPSTNY